MLTTCDTCGFACEAVWVGDLFEFSCDLCRTIAETETFTRVRDETHAEWSERNAEADRIAREMFAPLDALLASIGRNTARVLASI